MYYLHRLCISHESSVLRKGLIVLSWPMLTGLDRLWGQYEDLSKIASELIKYMLIIGPALSEHLSANVCA